MHTAKVVRQVQRDRVAMALELLAESVRQLLQPLNPHPHIQVLPFNKVCADVCGVGSAAQDSDARTNAPCEAAPYSAFSRGRAVQLCQHRAMYIEPKRTSGRLLINPLTSSGDLSPRGDTRS